MPSLERSLASKTFGKCLTTEVTRSSRSALLDTNLLLLAISGQVGFQRFRSFGRLQMFVESDVQLLRKLLEDYASISTTAYVLAEVSNLANKLSGPLRAEWYQALADYAVVTAEAHIPISAVGRLPEVIRFGITDAALQLLAPSHTVITAEFRLSGYLKLIGLDVINFNHLRGRGITKPA